MQGMAPSLAAGKRSMSYEKLLDINDNPIHKALRLGSVACKSNVPQTIFEIAKG
jgi:hypothetical protein